MSAFVRAVSLWAATGFAIGMAAFPTDTLAVDLRASRSPGDNTHDRGVFRAQATSLAPTTTVLASSPDPSVYRQNVTLTASVGAASGTPTGMVTFFDGATPLGSVALAGGVAAKVVDTLSVSMHNLSAVYSGDATYGTSNGVDTHTVNKASTTVILLDDFPDPSLVGESVLVAASVTANAPGGGTPSGVLQITAQGSAGCTIPLPGTQCSLFYTASGSRPISGAYAGDANYNGSSSAMARPHDVWRTASSTSITSDNPDPSGIGQTVTVVVSVVGAGSNFAPASGQVSVTGTNTTGCTFDRPNTSCNLTFSAGGPQTISAAYAGNFDYFGSISLTATHQVADIATTTTIGTHDPNPSVVGQAVAVNVTVAPAPDSGTVTVTGTNTAGCTITLPATSCNVVFTAAGAQTISASFGGTATFAPSATAAPTGHTVELGDTVFMSGFE